MIEDLICSVVNNPTKENIDDYDLTNDVRLNFAARGNEKINKLLDEFFAEKSVGERLQYLQTILSLKDGIIKTKSKRFSI